MCDLEALIRSIQTTVVRSAAWVELHAGALAATGTLLAVAIALFKDDIIDLWRRPRLVAGLRPEPPDCVLTPVTVPDLATGGLRLGRCLYLRLWVENVGTVAARDVHVYAAKLLEMGEGQGGQVVLRFLPMNLKWAHSQQRATGPEIFAPVIARGMGKHCDLAHIFRPADRPGDIAETPLPHLHIPLDSPIASFDLEVAPLTQSHLIGPGRYRLELKIAASNAKPRSLSIDFTLTGKWPADETAVIPDAIAFNQVQ
jgi:hypothetical protein